MPPRFAPFLVLPALLAGCVSQGPFPSLAPRAGEQLAIEEPVRAPVEVPSDPALLRRIAEHREQAARGERAFDAAYGPAEAAARAAGPAGSDSWIEAEQGISRLEAARGATMQALADLDRLASERADMPTNAADMDALTGMMAVVQDIADRQQARIDRLRR
jgi:hypothetical protein